MEQNSWLNKINDFKASQHSKVEYFIFNQDDFLTPDSEERIIIYTCNIDESDMTIFDFAIKCMYLEYKIDEGYMDKDHTWDKRKILYNPKEISSQQFYKTYSSYKSGLLTQPSIKINKSQIIIAYQLYEEWNSVFQIVQTKDKYYAFSWETTA
ncbi:MAG: hypothetical protein N4A57_00190 [Anaeromicrobium sp.]|jgi:hypothetical protein|uniref:hypothetical protein n=1 Tax=Anaeromicrobium sp. TaxID=1929132 RepID=UPI0025F3EDAC|nr:hypothetical protein [Anaeromicrobium sp.]MCT4592682.1 hypothetical protein [Anaeromicrobium sp.]